MKKWKLINSKQVFGNQWMSIDKRSYKLPDGTIKTDYYHLNRPDYVLIIAVDQKNNIILEKQYRRGTDKILYELPCGWIEKNETPTETAKRELKEETGYVGQATLLGVLDPQPGFCSMQTFVVKIKINKKVRSQNLDKDEHIKIYKLPLKKVFQMIKDGQITEMGTIAALMLYRLQKNDRIKIIS